MNTLERASQEAALTPEEIEKILLTCGERALLVGGQALAAWALYFGIQPVGVLSHSITTDAAFVGTSEAADALGRSLGHPWKVSKGTLDDAGGQVAKVYAKTSVGIKQVDFLSGIVGLDTERIRKRASHLSFPDGASVEILHPLDVLESRLRNIDSLPSKRNAIGVEQARLAVRVARAFIENGLDSGDRPREVRQAIKRVENIALDPRLAPVAFTHDIDVLHAIPVERIQSPEFIEKQWPKVLVALTRRRENFLKLQERRDLLRKTKSSGRTT